MSTSTAAIEASIHFHCVNHQLSRHEPVGEDSAWSGLSKQSWISGSKHISGHRITRLDHQDNSYVFGKTG
jgi:hypothetical protein